MAGIGPSLHWVPDSFSLSALQDRLYYPFPGLRNAVPRGWVRTKAAVLSLERPHFSRLTLVYSAFRFPFKVTISSLCLSHSTSFLSSRHSWWHYSLHRIYHFCVFWVPRQNETCLSSWLLYFQPLALCIVWLCLDEQIHSGCPSLRGNQ